MTKSSKKKPVDYPLIRPVAAGEDRSGKRRGLGISSLRFKVTSDDTDHLFVLENIFHEKGGPPRHLHFDQDEWFFIIEGRFIFEIGSERFTLGKGDSLFAPRGIPHVWASVAESGGRILVTFAPAGKMEAFFREVNKTDKMPTLDPGLWRAHGMEVVGPPLPV